MAEAISAADHYQRKRVAVLDSEMAYIDVGSGDSIVFLHGNPTSSYLWRNIIPAVESMGRCLAPDLIGMGDSAAEPNRSYRLADHIRYIDAWMDAVEVGDRVTLVIHDWGSALGLHWASKHPDRIKGIAYMESIVQSMGPEPTTIFALSRTPEGERQILEENFFVEGILGNTVKSEEAMNVYRKPYLEPGASRMPTLQWPREIPFDSGPADNLALINEYAAWMRTSDVPKLFVNAEPGAILVGDRRDFVRSFPNQTEVTVEGRHYIQEESPAAIAAALAAWYAGL
ncbi:MAG: haloalkane dehalogenase [Chloroflexi bacterium]|nr:haloalkane dehalogenase [Chloroflexota bacterium]MDA1146700.1 haloalkane dehalogenase [Chloroflexota bacterium]